MKKIVVTMMAFALMGCANLSTSEVTTMGWSDMPTGERYKLVRGQTDTVTGTDATTHVVAQCPPAETIAEFRNARKKLFAMAEAKGPEHYFRVLKVFFGMDNNGQPEIREPKCETVHAATVGSPSTPKTILNSALGLSVVGWGLRGSGDTINAYSTSHSGAVQSQGQGASLFQSQEINVPQTMMPMMGGGD